MPQRQISIEALQKLLSSSDGRDKLYKIIQYSAKFAQFLLRDKRLEGLLDAKTLTSQLNKLQSNISTGRKIMRLGKFLALYKAVFDFYDKWRLSPQTRVESLLQLIKATALAQYFLFDNINWLYRINALQSIPKPDQRTQSVTTYHPIGVLCKRLRMDSSTVTNKLCVWAYVVFLAIHSFQDFRELFRTFAAERSLVRTLTQSKDYDWMTYLYDVISLPYCYLRQHAIDALVPAPASMTDLTFLCHCHSPGSRLCDASSKHVMSLCINPLYHLQHSVVSDSDAESIRNIRKKRNKCLLAVAKDVSDATIAGNMLALYRDHNGWLGFFGLVSSAIGLYESWPLM